MKANPVSYPINYETVKKIFGLFVFAIVQTSTFAQEKALDLKMDFEDYDPPSTLVVPEHPLTRAKFPFIDVHNHQWNMPTQNLTELTEIMDKLNMAVMINLSGRG